MQKIKSKWKAQKRKEGLVAPRAQLDLVAGADEDRVARESREQGDEEDDASMSGSSESEGSEDDEESEEGGGDESVESSSGDEVPPKASTRPKVRKHRAGPSKNTDEQPQPSLRDLQRMAYSKSSLHTHKSDPLHRHKGGAAPKSRGAGGGGRRGGRGGGRGGGGGQRGRGRGQPDMGLRMKAMLEKIKQDYT